MPHDAVILQVLMPRPNITDNAMAAVRHSGYELDANISACWATRARSPFPGNMTYTQWTDVLFYHFRPKPTVPVTTLYFDAPPTLDIVREEYHRVRSIEGRAASGL